MAEVSRETRGASRLSVLTAVRDSEAVPARIHTLLLGGTDDHTLNRKHGDERRRDGAPN
jgi:hypothetical protein